MMKTKYFLSRLHNADTAETAIQDVESKRDEFLSAENSQIARISSETLQYVVFNNQQLRVVLTLSFYLKDV